MSREPGVTVVMPTYDGSLAYLREAFESARREGLRVLVVDDCSPSPAVRELVASWAGPDVEVVLRRRNYGLFANLNDGLARVRTSHAVILCGDDRLLEGAARTMEQRIAAWPDADLVVSEFIGIDPRGARVSREHGRFLDTITTTSRELAREEALRVVAEHGSLNGNITGMLFRVDGFVRLPKFRETWTHAADWAYLVGVAREGRMAISREPIAEVRWHEGNLSTVNYRSGRSMEEVAMLVGELAREPSLGAATKKVLDTRATYVLRMGLTSRRADVAERAVRALAREHGLFGPARELVRLTASTWAERLARRFSGASLLGRDAARRTDGG